MSTAIRTENRPPWAWWPMTVFAFLVAAYGLSYYLRLGAAFPEEFRDSFHDRPWGIYTHVLFGPIALALGPFQFRRSLLLRRRSLHRRLGVVYVVSAIMTGVVGLYMAAYSYGGMPTHLGFGLLGIVTGTATIKAYVHIRAGEVATHREWMIRSYAAVFAAVTLRIELPILAAVFGDFDPAYTVIAWLCWVPNLLVAELYVRRSRAVVASGLPRHSRVAVTPLP